MSTTDEKSLQNKSWEPQSATKQSSPSIRQGDNEDPAIRDFYGGAVSEAYRLKSELVAQHLADIGMGK